MTLPLTSEIIHHIRYEDLGNRDYLVISISQLFILIWSDCNCYIRIYKSKRYEDIGNIDYCIISTLSLFILIWSSCTCYIRIYTSNKIWRFREYRLSLHFYFTIVHFNLERLYMLHLNLYVEKDMKIYGIWSTSSFQFFPSSFWSGFRCRFYTRIFTSNKIADLRNMDYLFISISPIFILIWTSLYKLYRNFTSNMIWKFSEYGLLLHFHFSLVHF